MSHDCVFCKIAKGEIPSHKVFENDHGFAFLDIHPLTDGHAMVISKEHYERMEDVPIRQLGGLFEAVQAVSHAVLKAFAAPATTIGINNGVAAGQVVPHLHIHVVPRFEGDGGGSIHSIIKSSKKRDLAEVKSLILSKIRER